MLDLPFEDVVFIVVALCGGVGFLATIGRTGQPIGGASLWQVVLAFVSLFGVGGLIASRVLDVHGAQALIAATGAGVVGMGLAITILGTRRRAKE